jgi:hypothetical protein
MREKLESPHFELEGCLVVDERTSFQLVGRLFDLE